MEKNNLIKLLKLKDLNNNNNNNQLKKKKHKPIMMMILLLKWIHNKVI